MDEQYKISLGVDIDIDDLQSQINRAGDKVKPIPIKIEIENLSEIKKQLQNLGGTKGNTKVAIPIDTASVENALKEVSSHIKDIRNSIGTLDSKSGMQSLLSSINQIVSALGKATDESQTLVNSLNALASKDFGFNFNVKFGGSNSPSNNAVYGDVVRNQIIPELQRQERALAQYLAKYYNTNELSAIDMLLSKAGNGLSGGVGGVISILDKLNQPIKKGELGLRMQELRDYINLIQQSAAKLGVDLSPVMSGFDKPANELVDWANNIRNGVTEAQNSITEFENVLQRVFGGANNINVEGIAQQLESIIANFKELKEVIAGLSTNVSIEGLSDQLNPIVTGLTEIKDAITALSSGISIEGLTQSFEKLSTSIDKLVSNIGVVKTTLNTGLSGADTGLEGVGTSIVEVDQKLRRLSDIKIDSLDGADLTTQINNLKTALNSFGFDGTAIDVITKDLEEMRVAVRGVTTSLNNDGSITLTVKGVDEYERAVTAIKRVILEAKTGKFKVEDFGIKVSQSFNRVAEAADRITKKLAGSNLGTSKFDDEILEITTKFGRLSAKSDELKTGIEQLRGAFDQIKAASTNQDIEALIAANTRYENILRDVNSQLRQQAVIEQQAADAERRAASNAALEQSRAKLSLDMDNWLKENSAAAKDFGARIKELQAQIANCDKTNLSRLRAEFINIKKEAQLAGKSTQSLGDKLKAQFSKYSSYLSVASLFSYAYQGLRDMFNQVVAIDTAMTELKKVTNETDASYNSFLSRAAIKSKELGTTIDGLVESTADFARLGYGFEESQGLAEVANIYAVVGDEIDSVADATQSLISTLAAYKDEASGISDSDFAMEIVDKFNEVSNNFAISSGGIGEAMQRSASSLRAANNTIDESIALITAANTVVQDPTVIGRLMPI